jgi:hypothetical protein
MFLGSFSSLRNAYYIWLVCPSVYTHETTGVPPTNTHEYILEFFFKTSRNIHHRHHHLWQNSPFWAITFLRRFFQTCLFRRELDHPVFATLDLATVIFFYRARSSSQGYGGGILTRLHMGPRHIPVLVKIRQQWILTGAISVFLRTSSGQLVKCFQQKLLTKSVLTFCIPVQFHRSYSRYLNKMERSPHNCHPTHVYPHIFSNQQWSSEHTQRLPKLASRHYWNLTFPSDFVNLFV